MLGIVTRMLENATGTKVTRQEAIKSIEMAKSDVICNSLLLGQDVTAKQFETVLIRCLNVRRRCTQYENNRD